MPKMPKIATIAVALAAALMAGAASADGASPVDGRWQASGLAAPAGKPLPGITLAGGTLKGHDSCNRLFGRYTLSGEGGILFEVGSTRMACADMTAANAFHAALTGARHYALAGGRLLLRDGEGRDLLALDPAP